MRRLVFVILALFCLSACVSRKTVIRDRTLMEEYYKRQMSEERSRYTSCIDSLRMNMSRRDTSWIRDSFIVKTEYRNDTVYVDRERIIREYHGWSELKDKFRWLSSDDSVSIVHDTVYLSTTNKAENHETEVTKSRSAAWKWILGIVMIIIVVVVRIYFLVYKRRT